MWGCVSGVRGANLTHPWPPEVDADLRRTVRGGTLILAQVEPNDTQVMQCEAGNRHGRLLANAYVHVLGEPQRPVPG